MGDDGTPRVVVLQKQAFMRPAECAAGTSTDRVRYFGADRLTPQGRATPWPSVLVVCQDPFTACAAQRPFGLAHVRFNAPPTALALPAVAEADTDDVPTEEERDGDDATGPTLPMDVDSPVHTTPAAAASNRDEEGTLPTLLLTEDDDEPEALGRTLPLTDDEEGGGAAAAAAAQERAASMRADTVILPDIRAEEHEKAEEKHAASMRADTVILPDIRAEEPEALVDETSAISAGADTGTGAAAAAAAAAAAKDDFQRGVVLAVSGFVNPERAQIRDAVTRYGGRYTNDVTEATHLVCAFADTPKYREMQRKRGGVVVSKDWVFACAKAHRRLPEAQFALGTPAGSSGSLAPATPPRKSPAVRVTPERKKGGQRRRKRDPNDSEYESSGPDEYDLTDPFVVPDESSGGSVGGRAEEDDDEEEEEERHEAAAVGAENLAETLREAQEFIREYDAREARRRREAPARGHDEIDLTQMPRAAPRRRTRPAAAAAEDEDDGYATDEMGEDVLSDRLRVFLGAGAAGAEARRWCASRPAH